MSIEKMFETAARNKVRFPHNGSISTEDLFDLPVESLDAIFKKLNSQMKKASEESLLTTKSEADEALVVQIEIVKHVVSLKLEEKATREQAVEKKQKKQHILSLIAEKDNEAMRNMSKEDLQKLLNEI